jgi:hypothetical protein
MAGLPVSSAGFLMTVRVSASAAVPAVVALPHGLPRSLVLRLLVVAVVSSGGAGWLPCILMIGVYDSWYRWPQQHQRRFDRKSAEYLFIGVVRARSVHQVGSSRSYPASGSYHTAAVASRRGAIYYYLLRHLTAAECLKLRPVRSRPTPAATGANTCSSGIWWSAITDFALTDQGRSVLDALIRKARPG